MKHVAATIIGVALVIDVAIFIGLAYGTGAASLTTSGGLFFGPTWHNDTNGAGGAIQPNVYVQLGTLPMVSSMLAGGTSTTVTFGMNVISNNNCGNAGDPAWAPGIAGSGGNPAYYEIQYLVNGQAQKFTAGIDGQQQTGYAVFATNNNTYQSTSNDPNIYLCFYANGISGGGNIQTANFGSTPFFLHTVNLAGVAGAGTLQITIPANGPLCDGLIVSGGGTPVCSEAFSAASETNLRQAQGTWTTSSSVSIPVLNGQAAFSLAGAGPWYNGGTISAIVSTGYGGSGGYSLSVHDPGVRGGGLSTWGNNPQSVANEQNGASFTFQIPAGASTNCTTSGCNQFQMELTSSALGQTLSFPIDIAPQFAPSLPGIAYSTGSGFVYPIGGDSVTLTFTTSVAQPNASNVPSTFLISVFYLLPGANPQTSKSCDASWITPCNGTIITGSNGGGGFTGSYTFSVNAPLGYTGIGVRAQAETSQQQSSGISYRYIFIQPAGCNPGSPCDPTTSGASLWKLVGPALLMAAFVLLAMFVLIFVPISPVHKYLIVFVVAVAGVAGYFLIASQFVPGGVFG